MKSSSRVKIFWRTYFKVRQLRNFVYNPATYKGNGIMIQLANRVEELTVFKIGENYFALSSNEVQEIIRPPTLTPVRRGPDFVAGIINLRGEIVTIIDPRKKLVINKTSSGEKKIVVALYKNKKVGLLVDEVEDIIRPEEGTMEPPPGGEEHRFLNMVCKQDNYLISILSLAEILDFDKSEAV